MEGTSPITSHSIKKKNNDNHNHNHNHNHNKKKFYKHINVLPSEVLSLILSQVIDLHCCKPSHFKPLHLASLVCLEWNVLSKDSSLWKKYPLALKENEFPEKIKYLLDPRLRLIDSLFISNEKLQKDSDEVSHYLHIVFGCQDCSKCATIMNQINESDQLDFNYSYTFDSIKILQIQNCKIEDKAFQHICQLKLVSLSLVHCNFEDNQSIQYITQVKSTLKVLELSCLDFKEEHFFYIDQLTDLKKLHLDWTPFVREFPPLPQLTNLEKLSVCTSSLNQDFFEMLSRYTNLQSLFLTNVATDFDHTLVNPLPHLTRLSLQCNAVSETTLILFLTPFLLTLKEITFSGTTLSKLTIQKIISFAPHLRMFFLGSSSIERGELDELNRIYHNTLEFIEMFDV